ncbi:hypothetical protein OSTOST_15593 [Ostertagia ostertagi]
MMQQGHGQGHPSHNYTGDVNSPVSHGNTSSTNMYETGTSSTSMNMPTSAPSSAAASSQSSIGNHVQTYQQSIGMQYQPSPVISPSNTPQSGAVQNHLPQQAQPGYSTSTLYSYPQTTAITNQKV